MAKNLKEKEHHFSKFSQKTAELLGSPWIFILFLILTVFWIVIGYFLNFSETWVFLSHFIPNVITLFIVFSIQNSENRSTKATHIKLDELILIHDEARNNILDLSKLSDEQLKELEKKYEDLCNVSSADVKKPD